MVGLGIARSVPVATAAPQPFVCPEPPTSGARFGGSHVIVEGLSITSVIGGDVPTGYSPEFGDEVIIHEEDPLAEAVFIFGP